jgi:hypothetical protein
MNIKLISAVLAGLILLPVARADDKPKVREQLVAISDAFIPSGFDSDSDAFVVVNGLFPNGCYRFRDTKVDHVGPALHEVRAYAQVSEGLCLMVLVPFSKEVQLGKLSAGDHAIRFMSSDGTFWEKRMSVEN